MFVSFQLHTTQGENGTTVHSVQGIDSNGHTENMTVDLTDATLGQDGQIIITGEDGHGNYFSTILTVNYFLNYFNFFFQITFYNLHIHYH